MTKQNVGLNSGAFTGSKDAGNPYEGDLGKGIAYDNNEAKTLGIESENNFPRIVPIYRLEARRLIHHLSSEKKETLLDLGSGTGICTLELLCRHPESRIIGVEISEGMMNVAKYKFHQDDGQELLVHVGNTDILSYWDRFRQESLFHKERVKFFKGDIQEETLFAVESIDGAVANQVIHWTDLSKTLNNFQQWLKSDGEVVWNSASHWYNDASFPALEYSVRFNDFMKYVLDEVNRSIPVNDIYTLPTPTHNLDSIKLASAEHGLQTEQVATYLVPFDLQTVVQNHVPICVKSLVVDSELRNVSDDLIARLIRAAISTAINDPRALGDFKHKYEIVPVFRTTKK